MTLISNSDVSIGDTERWAGGWHHTGQNGQLPWGYVVILKFRNFDKLVCSQK